MLFANTWNRIVDWFQDRSERNRLVRSFNDSAKHAFVAGLAPTLLKASISRGERSFRHQFSNWLNSGFRIQAFTGRALSKNELIVIGNTIISDPVLIRKLVVLGFDTLEVCDYIEMYGCRWQLKDYLQISNY